MKNKLLKSVITLSLLTNAGTASYFFTELNDQEAKIQDLKGDVKTKSSEIANLSDVIAKKDDSLNAKKKVIVKQKLQIENTQQEKTQLKEILKAEKELRIKSERKFSLVKAEKEMIKRAEAKAEAESKARLKKATEKAVTKQHVTSNPVTEPKSKPHTQAKKQSVSTPSKSVGSFQVTAYVATCNGCSGITASGYNVRGTVTYKGMRIIATDPSVIPMRSIVRITTGSGSFTAIALDTGGAINGHIIDYLVSSESEALSFGRQNATIEIIGKE